MNEAEITYIDHLYTKLSQASLEYETIAMKIAEKILPKEYYEGNMCDWSALTWKLWEERTIIEGYARDMEKARKVFPILLKRIENLSKSNEG